jgi:hypothetical protein
VVNEDDITGAGSLRVVHGGGTVSASPGTDPSTIQASDSAGFASVTGSTGNGMRTDGGPNTMGGTSCGANRR